MEANQEIKVAVYAEHTLRGGVLVLDHDDDCASDDHYHLTFASRSEALEYAATEEQEHPYSPFHWRLAAAVRLAVM